MSTPTFNSGPGLTLSHSSSNNDHKPDNTPGFISTYTSTDADKPVNAQMQSPSHTARTPQFPYDLFTESTVRVPTGLPHQPFMFQGAGNVGDLAGTGSQFGSK
ncbi:hypothetical protein AUP68_00028 [Ilyonectria robusta]